VQSHCQLQLRATASANSLLTLAWIPTFVGMTIHFVRSRCVNVIPAQAGIHASIHDSDPRRFRLMPSGVGP
jgi:hypothetical protein